jgi:transglutaminase superfamily protein
MTKWSLLVRACIGLVAHDLFMARHDFSSLHRRVRDFGLHATASCADPQAIVGSALDLACCFYPKKVLCLQRSAVLVKMLRQNGVPAQMMIGAQKLPFKAHAWVEVNGKAFNDRLAEREKFLVLEVC